LFVRNSIQKKFKTKLYGSQNKAKKIDFSNLLIYVPNVLKIFQNLVPSLTLGIPPPSTADEERRNHETPADAISALRALLKQPPLEECRELSVEALDWSLPARERKSDTVRLAGCLRKVDEVQTNDEHVAYADTKRQLAVEQKRNVWPFFHLY
jgi:hypothetical protein